MSICDETRGLAYSHYPDRAPFSDPATGAPAGLVAERATGDCSVHEAVDCVVEEAERYAIGQWARIRDVTEDAVRSNINAAREKLLAEEDREH